MSEHAELLAAMLEEQRRTNQLLTALVNLMLDSDEEDEGEAIPSTYLDGSPIQ